MLEILETPITALHIFAACILILIILIQPGKSGGLTAALGGAGTQQVFGGRGAGNFLSRGTWILAGTFFLTSVVLAYMSSSTDDSISKGSHKTHHSAPAPKKSAPAKK
jgi:preprotein translocase subunit SecG